MDLGGNLAVMEPSMIFQVTGLCGLTGKMKLITMDNVASFWFKEGGLLFATIDTGKKKSTAVTHVKEKLQPRITKARMAMDGSRKETSAPENTTPARMRSAASRARNNAWPQLTNMAMPSRAISR